MTNIENMPKLANTYIGTKDKNLKYTYCSENLAALIGLDVPRQAIGKTDYELFPEPFAEVYRAGDKQILSGGIYLNVFELHPHLDTTISIVVSKCKLQNKSGSDNGLIFSFLEASQTAAIQKINSNLLKYDEEKKKYKFSIGQETIYFTPREYQVFQYILMGHTAKQIGKKIYLSHRTVEDYIKRIRYKLQCESKYHIVETALRYGVIQQNI